MRTVCFFAFISFMLLSCNTPRYMYSPSVQNVPVLTKRGDSKISASYSTDLSNSPLTRSSGRDNEKNEGYDLQGAVAITDHFAIQANYFQRSERDRGDDDRTDSTIINYRRNLLEFGIGYYRSMGRRDKVLFQVFAGAGKGRYSFTEEGKKDGNNFFYTRDHQADIFKVYLQPAFLFRIRENFTMSVSSRFSFINYRNIQTNYTESELQSYKLDDLPYGSRVFLEPAFTNSFGFKGLPGVKFEYQIMFVAQISERLIDYRPFNFSIGVQLDIPKMFKPARE